MCLFSLCNSAHSQQFEYLSYNWIELHTPTACYENKEFVYDLMDSRGYGASTSE